MKTYIIAAKRTAIGKFLGSTLHLTAAEMAAAVIKDIIKETGIDPANIDEVIVGNVLSAGQGQGVARQSAIKGGIPVEVPAYGINMICGSGMKAVLNAVNAIKSGFENLLLAGGTESMSTAGYVIPGNVRDGHRMGHLSTIDHMVHDGLTDAFSGEHMGITAENIAEKYNISRQEQDEFALESQRRAVAAIDEGRFRDEIVPLEYKVKKEVRVFDTDEFPNRTTSNEKLERLRPAFKKDGTVTAGNASGINDGASFLLIASEEAVKKYNLKPLCEIIGIGQGGVDPDYMGLGPVPAIRMALKNSGETLDKMNIIELNEAFAAQSLGVMRELIDEHHVTREWLMEHTNLNGGAIALGHPIGASGNRIIVSLVHQMLKLNAEYGLASLCIGGGMGTAVVLKSVNANN